MGQRLKSFGHSSLVGGDKACKACGFFVSSFLIPGVIYLLKVDKDYLFVYSYFL